MVIDRRSFVAVAAAALAASAAAPIALVAGAPQEITAAVTSCCYHGGRWYFVLDAFPATVFARETDWLLPIRVGDEYTVRVER
jgi:hypothetical protein